MHIYCDFDGTITAQDTTDTVLRELAHPEWESLEAAWVAGQISAAECMRKQIALIQGDDAALEAVLDKIDLRTGFAAFARWCKEEDLPLIVVSDGVDFMIRHVLNRHGLGYLPIFANQLAGAPGARLLDQPWSASACMNKSGVCKCRVTRAGVPSPLVYVGDGRSDFCIAEEADLLFARATLARHCVDQGLAFIPYDNFSDVQRYLFLVRLDGRRETVPTFLAIRSVQAAMPRRSGDISPCDHGTTRAHQNRSSPPCSMARAPCPASWGVSTPRKAVWKG